MAESIRIQLPLTDEDIDRLQAGDHVLLSGPLLAFRDAAHKRLVAALDKGEPLPVDLRGEIVYYVGPTPAPPGRVIGSAGPTTSMRLDPFTPRLLEAGMKGSLGKGGRGPAVREAIKKYHGIYLMAVGGTGALLSAKIKKVEVLAYEDLGTEAIRRMVLEDFPAIVMIDTKGNDLSAIGKAQWQDRAALGSYTPSGNVAAG